MPRILITEPDKTPQPYKIGLDREIIKIGRANDNDLPLTDSSTSSHHCVIKRVEGGYILEDKNSTNGVKLDEQEFDVIDLNQDLKFNLGDVDVSFTLTEEEFDILSEEEHFRSKQSLKGGRKTTSRPTREHQETVPQSSNPYLKKKKPSPVPFIAICVIGFAIGLCVKHYQKNGTVLPLDMLTRPELPKED